MERLYDLWAKRNPQWETKYEKELLRQFTDYGRGSSQYQDARGKTFGAGYELYIIAFFIGLYANQTKPLVEDASKRKGFGQPIHYWGNLENRNGRVSYGKIREYIFAALVARTNIDYLALDKGEIEPSKVVDILIDKMEEYANYGFAHMHEQLENNPNCYFKDSAFLNEILPFAIKEQSNPKAEEAEGLD